MHLRKTTTLPLIAVFCLAPVLRADDEDNAPGHVKNVVYVQTNDYFAGQNSVLAYTRNPTTGALTEIHGSPFPTGGAGLHNSNDALGPDDSDKEVVATPDRRFLYVTNQGSDTIAGFAIQSDGSLRTVPGSPFPSGGAEPVSIGIDGPLMFVVNRGDQIGFSQGTHAPSYASFLILPEGSLLPLPFPEPALTVGASATQALIAPGGRLMFDSHLFEDPFNNSGFPPFLPPFSAELHSYRITPFGTLIPLAKTVPPDGIPPFILGLQAHPTRKILYTGYVLAGLLATYTYDDSGNMTFVGTTPSASPLSGICWIAITADAKYLYTADSLTDQVDVYSIAADPLHPVHVQSVLLGGTKNPGGFPVTANFYDTTPFQLETSPDGEFLYVMNHEVADPVGSTTGNALHILKIGSGGMLTEIPSSPLVFPLNEVTMTAHPQGVVVF